MDTSRNSATSSALKKSSLGMRISQKGIDLIKRFEGCSLSAYKCPGGIWTIGWGHTAGVKQGDRITQEKADELLKKDLKVFEGHVNTLFTPEELRTSGESSNASTLRRTLNQNQFDALVSFCYNCGEANLRKLVSNRNAAAIAAAITLYNKSGGKVLAGLVKRREAEKALFIS